jgi:hypothetical protein
MSFKHKSPFPYHLTRISIDRLYFMTSALNFALIVFDSVACRSKTFARMHSVLVPSRSSLSHVHRSSFTSAYSFFLFLTAHHRSTSISISLVICYVTLSDSDQVHEHIPVEPRLHFLRLASLR